MRWGDTKLYVIAGKPGNYSQAESIYMGLRWEKVQASKFSNLMHSYTSPFYTSIYTGLRGLPGLWAAAQGSKKGSEKPINIAELHNKMVKKLLEGLADRGFGRDPMAEMQKIIGAENSDLFDVLAYVAFALSPVTRQRRAEGAKNQIGQSFTDKQKAFIEFVLSQYVQLGVDELAQENLTPLLRVKYSDSIQDAVDDLGGVEQARKAFIGFQKFLYQQKSAGTSR
jgi:hypothetical protein